jgi:hypothetical protein
MTCLLAGVSETISDNIEGRRQGMKGFSRFGAIATFAVLMTVVFAAPMSAVDKKDWTVMVYMDGDNNLETYAILNTDQLELVGSDANVNFLVLMDTLAGPADLLYVIDSQDGQSMSVGGNYGYPKEVNMSDPAVLEQFIEIGVKDFPAEKYAVILWDHGGGWRGICWDDTTLELYGIDDCITMTEMRDAFAGAYKETGEVIDVVGFDACLMAMPEVSFQLRDYASFLVFSEETVPGLGFPYDMFAADLVDEPTVDGEEFAKIIAKDYSDYYASISGCIDVTISVFDMAYMDELTAAVDYLGTELLASLSTYVNSYQKDQIQADRYYYPYNVDLIGFAKNLVADSSIDDPGIKDAAQKVVIAAEKGVLVAYNSIVNVGSTGLAIYFPSTHDGMHSLKEEYKTIPFAVETSWYKFCEAFSDFNGRTWAKKTG